MTNKIIIRPIEINDGDSLYHLILTQKERFHTYFPKTLKDIENISSGEYIKRVIDKRTNRFLFFYVAEKIDTSEIIGILLIKDIDWSVPKCDIAYFMSEKEEGKGYMTILVKELLKVCFNELNMERVSARIAPDNVGSQRVVLKNGFLNEGTLRNFFRTYEGNLIDVLYFGLLKGDFFLQE